MASLHFYKQTYKQTDKQTDLVLEVSPPDVGHINTGTGTIHKPKSETKKSLNQTQLI